MKTAKRIISLILTGVMILSMFSIGITANAVTPTGTVLTEIPTTAGARPKVQFYCTEITRVAKGANSVEPGNVIVKATPSGVPELSGAYAAQAYAGETPAATRITFTSDTVGVTPVKLSCSNETVQFSAMSYDGSTGTYTTDIIAGTAQAGEALVFTMDYKWTDGNEYQEKCVSYVEDIVTGGVFTYIECTFKPFSGTRSFYRTSVSAITRLLGKGVYYEQPATITTSDTDPYKSYGVYNGATADYLSNVASGYNTLLYKDDKNVEAKGATKDIYFDNFIPGVPTAHVYVDSSKSATLADINLRMDASTQMLSDRNNKNPYTAVSNMYVYEGLQTAALAGASNVGAETTLGYAIPAKANYGVTQKKENASMTTVTGGARAYSKIFTKGFTGTVANIADGSEYTITNEYYSYNYVEDAVLIEGNLTTIAQVPTPVVFHIVDKGALWDLLERVMTSDPDTPSTRSTLKGTNPQAWYYKSGFSNFQNAYVEALRVANNPKASQSEVNAVTKSLQTMYNGLQLKTANYTEVNELNEIADSIIENAYAYDPAEVALVEQAQELVEKNYNILYQNAVDVMADNLRLAINNATPAPADYQDVYAAKIAFEALDKEIYTEESWQNVLDVIDTVVYGLSVLDQDIVDGYAQAILDATAALKIKTAEFNELIATVEEANALKEKHYANFEILAEPLKAAEDAIADSIINIWLPEKQQEVDELNAALRNAIDSLVLNNLDKTALKTALDSELKVNEKYYDQTLLDSYKELVAEGQAIYDDDTLTVFDQETVDDKTAEIVSAYETLQASYNPPVDLTGLEEALNNADELVLEDYVNDDALAEFIAAKEAAEELYTSDLTAESEQAVIDATTRLENAINSLNFLPADVTALKDLTFELVTMDYEEVFVITYIDGVLGEEYVEKYNNSDIRALINSINSFLKEELTIKDTDRINAFIAETNAKIASLETYKTDEYLQIAIAEYENSDTDLCSEEEWATYTEAYNVATELKEDSSQDDINTALTNLVNAIPEEIFVPVDKTELEETLAATDELDLSQYKNDAAMYELLDAIAEGSEILKADLTDSEENRKIVADSVERITTAVLNLNFNDADFTEIAELISTLDALKSETITVVTYVAGELGSADKAKYDLSAIEAIEEKVISFNKNGLTIKDQQVVIDFVAEIEADIAALKVLVYTEYLDAAVSEYEAVEDSSIYTDETWNNYQEKYETAVALTDATQDNINTALTTLVNAKNALELEPVNTYIFAAQEGSTTVIDRESGFIYGLETGITDLEDYVDYSDGVTIDAPNGYGTGTVISTILDGEVIETFTIVIFGDLTGDGVIDIYDAATLAALVNGDIEIDGDSAVYFAADLNGDTVADIYDLAIINAVVNGEIEI